MADNNSGILGRLLTETWPARAGHSILEALMMPGQVAGGVLNVPPQTPGMWSDEDEARKQATYNTMTDRAAGLGGLMMMGASGAPAMTNAVGMGVRTLPPDNYLKNLSSYTKNLYRETSPEEALFNLPHSPASASYGPSGAQRAFYADTPDLALGQGANKGVRVGYDASAFEGQIHQKPGWQTAFEGGAAEYMAAPSRNADVRGAVNSIDIDKSALAAAPRHVQANFNRTLEQLRSNGWEIQDTAAAFKLTKR